jgi:hypothetical protein
LGASLINIGFFRKRRIINKIIAPKKFRKNANSAGPEKFNATFI